MTAAYERVIGPAVPVVTLAEVKEQSRIDASDDDGRVQAYIDAATSHFDGDGPLGRAMITQTWAQWESQSPGHVKLRMGPFQALVSIEYYDKAGVLQSADIADFETWKRGDYVTLKPRDNAEWPDADTRPDAIKITYTAGFGDTAAEVPEGIRHAIILTAAHWYEHRAAVTELKLNPIPFGVDALIDRHRAAWYG